MTGSNGFGTVVDPKLVTSQSFNINRSIDVVQHRNHQLNSHATDLPISLELPHASLNNSSNQEQQVQ